MYRGHRVIDGHIHFTLDAEPAFYVDFLSASGTDAANLAVITRGNTLPCTPESLALKALYPERFYVCAALDPLEYCRGGDDMGRRLAEYAGRMLSCGCDGIKMLEGKPQLRKALPVPGFDEPCWEDFWQFAEESQTPLLWHVNDPAAFWDRENIPAWAEKAGWFYDESYINNEAQYTQVLNVLERHPRLKVILAHAFFMSEDLDRLGDILSRYPDVMTDLTPGIEMYDAFSQRPEQTRDFFETFGDRIIYGTDTGSRFVYGGRGKTFDEKENTRRHEIVRDFLFGTEPRIISADGHFVHDRPDFLMMPLGLAGERLDAILSGNFMRFIGGAPKKTDREAALDECLRLKKAEPEALRLGFKSNLRNIERAEKYLRKEL